MGLGYRGFIAEDAKSRLAKQGGGIVRHFPHRGVLKKDEEQIEYRKCEVMVSKKRLVTLPIRISFALPRRY